MGTEAVVLMTRHVFRKNFDNLYFVYAYYIIPLKLR